MTKKGKKDRQKSNILQAIEKPLSWENKQMANKHTISH